MCEYKIMTNVKETVHNLFSAGIQNRETLLGFHGTSWEAIKHLLTTGKLPPSNSKNREAGDHSPGKIYFALTKNALPNHPLAGTFWSTVQDAFDEAKGYADDVGVVHGFIQHLNLDLNDRMLTTGCRSAASGARTNPHGIDNMEEFFRLMHEPNGYRYLSNLGISDSAIWSAMQIAKVRNGIVLGLKQTIMHTFQVLEGNKNNRDLSIVCPDGLPVEFISGLEPIGQFEYNQLDALQ